jgi:hypothetical protein
MKRLLLLALLAAVACGSDDEEKPKPAAPKCLSDAKLSGGVSLDSAVEYECGDGLSYVTTSAHVTVELRLPNEAGFLGVRLFGLQGSTAAGSELGAGMEIQTGLPPTEQWSAGLDSGSACTASIEEQARRDDLDLVLVTASVSCSEPLLSETAGVAPVTVERLRIRALYAP